ncbi:MAG: zinc-ribbon domain-containing protein [Candidatus Hydrothermarchaeales archaeon]
MLFCTHCGHEAEKGDVFCRRCGTKLRDVSSGKDEIERTVKDLRVLVDKVAEQIKIELLEQVSEIESGIRTGSFTKKEFEAEVQEIKGRLSRFTEESKAGRHR